jgi:methylated-DNA-protein-cysteine methyltransferase-like protein
MTYGQIARLLSHRLSARAVGWAMSVCPDDVPWQRVINAMGGCSADRVNGRPGWQRVLLEKEGVRFASSGLIDVESYRWALPRRRLVRPVNRRSE